MYRHLLKMTDSTGIIQFSSISSPLPESGYTVDDNARALIVAMEMEGKERERLIKTYSNFLKEAQCHTGEWLNLKVNGRFLSIINSQDCVGRGVLAASYAVSCGVPETEHIAKKMLGKALPKAINLSSPRAMAYVLLGVVNLIDSIGITDLYPKGREIADKLIGLYDINHAHCWLWFEEILTYCNALLPHSLFAFYTVSDDKRALTVAKDTLDFLCESLFKKGYLNIVGNKGWWKKRAEIPPYDQQPVDAASIVLACLQAYLATREIEYIRKAQLAYDWYFGKNINNVPLYNDRTQGCHDALVPDGVNLNQGAEAVVSFLLAHRMLENVIEQRYQRLIPAV
jgi:hypothetical protein